eukprot:4839146-Alexandrium_andersonii.AAC.1
MGAVHSRTTRQWARRWLRAWYQIRTRTGTWSARPSLPRGAPTWEGSSTPTARSWAWDQRALTKGTRPRWRRAF